jgi:glyoxylase-like metal-dependent hydrolase (beta-lactamase superfamily II)
MGARCNLAYRARCSNTSMTTVPTDPALQVEGFFDAATCSVTYLVLDPASRQCAIVDSVLDYDPESGRTGAAGAGRLLARVAELGASVQWILETHLHADHLSAAQWIRERVGGKLGIGRRITDMQRVFGKLFNAGPGFIADGSQFDHLFDDGESFAIGTLRATAMHTPGHTPGCMSFIVPGATHTAAFIGDTLFMPDYGSARCDFPGGDATALFRSVRRLLELPGDTVLYLCHDYAPAGRATCFATTVAAQRAANVHVRDGVTEDEFVAMRTARDATLAKPQLLLPAVQVNMRGGALPEPEANGVRYLKIPLDAV